nr:MAG TPA: hypothetical protein [Bacteriophage sp.]
MLSLHQFYILSFKKISFRFFYIIYDFFCLFNTFKKNTISP